ncbi:unnamed protein product [Phaedon cochleariae]|uniref:Uncharacterized protein n=1 Tax=Phaedon cochleariae TaxID=80249 RepID=A0A9N9SEV0_PHACE|nr:unnamed protein product [Phaedon cochleariae]
METKTRPNFWWLKSAPTTPAPTTEKDGNLSVPKLNLRPSTSLVDLLEKDKENVESDVDVGSIIEEINRVAAQSPLGPYEKPLGDRSIDDLMKEAEKIYLESSKSFEQLSQRSKTSQNISDLISKDSTPTPQSLSPLPMDPEHSEDDYSEDFSEESKLETTPPANKIIELVQEETNIKNDKDNNPDNNIDTNRSRENVSSISRSKSVATLKDSQSIRDRMIKSLSASQSLGHSLVVDSAKFHKDEQFEQIKSELELKNNLISTLEENNRSLKFDMEEVKVHKSG